MHRIKSRLHCGCYIALNDSLCEYDMQEIEMHRRLALEKRLAEEEKKDSLKKKKKIKF